MKKTAVQISAKTHACRNELSGGVAAYTMPLVREEQPDDKQPAGAPA